MVGRNGRAGPSQTLLVRGDAPPRGFPSARVYGCNFRFRALVVAWGRMYLQLRQLGFREMRNWRNPALLFGLAKRLLIKE